jgi:regulatory protein
MSESDGAVVEGIRDSRVPDRLWCVLEGGERLAVSPDLVLRYSLSPGRVLDAEELAALRADASRAGAKARALRALSARPMSREELKARLRQKGESAEDAEDAVELMERVGFVNDQEYARQIVRWCSRKGYGRQRVLSEFSRRRVPKEYWDEALEELPEPEETLDRLIDARLNSGSDAKEIKKLTDALMRRGFAGQAVRAAIRRHLDNTEGYEDWE